MASVVAVHSELTAPTNVFRRVMAKHPELVLIVIGLTLTLISRYGSSLKQKPITIPPKPPKKFFPGNSPVYDYYNGDLEPVVRLLGQEELIFLMYYAPWCSRSMAIRWEFHKAAKHMTGQVKFVAVNCWWPDGQCRKRYKFLMFPILFVYHTHLDGFRYIGQMSAEHMVKFVEDLIYPLRALHSHDQIKDFVARNDGAVVGYFDVNSSPQPPGFQQFYFASMRTQEQDPYNQIRFGVITNEKIAQYYNLTRPKEVVLFRLTNTTLKYPHNYNFTSSQIVSWALENRQKPLVRLLAPMGVKSLIPSREIEQGPAVIAFYSINPLFDTNQPYHPLVRLLAPMGVKSLILSREIEQGPAVIAFYSINPLFDTNQPYHVMKDLALHYHNCEGISNLEDAITRWRSQILSAQIEYHQVVEFCANYRKQQNTGLFDFKCCVSLATKTLEESPNQAQNVCEYCVHTQNQVKPDCSSIDVDSHILKWTNLRTNYCSNSVVNYNINEYHSLCCESCASSRVPVSPSDYLPMSFRSRKRRLTDRYIWQQMQNKPKRLCRKLTLQKLQGHEPYDDYYEFDKSLPLNFTGLGCRTNRTVNFYAMDAIRHSVFAERLGVNISTLPNNPAVVIFDKENEEQYLLKETFTAQNVASFILNFTHGYARRTLRSLSTVNKVCDKVETSVCVIEVTTETFQTLVLDPQKDVLLFVYSSWCGFCANINHVYLALAKYFRSADSIIFARINGDTNDLPWEYTVDSYPSLVFFPANRKSDSVVFPDYVSVILPNLIRFVLQHSTQSLRVETALGVCSKSCISKNRQYALRARHSLQQKQIRLRHRLSMLTAQKDHLNDIAQTFNVISQKYVQKRLQQIRKNLKVVEQLLQFLEASNGVFIEHSKLHQFMMEHQLLQEKSKDTTY